MNRTNLLLLSIAVIVLTTVGVIVFLSDLEGLGIGIMIIGSLVSAVAWVMGLIMAGQRQQWVWLVVIAFTNTLGTLLYALVGIDESA